MNFDDFVHVGSARLLACPILEDAPMPGHATKGASDATTQYRSDSVVGESRLAAMAISSSAVEMAS
ncbi:MAG: hypothetical protein OEV05_14385, partial [Gammaproteobacteria bacterium]|nr:hypothetical protein [Gammaproteobacteria bacterium]